MKKIVALHTSQAIVTRLKELWAVNEIPGELINIVDDSLIWEVITNNGPTEGVHRRMLKYAQAASDIGADYVFNTCSSVGDVAEAIKPFCALPLIKIDEPMARRAIASVAAGGTIGVLATLPTTLPPTCNLLEKTAAEMGKTVVIQRFLAEGAFPKYMSGDVETHNAIVLKKAEEAAEQVDILVLAQASMALLAPKITEITGKEVLSSPESGVAQFLELLQA